MKKCSRHRLTQLVSLLFFHAVLHFISTSDELPSSGPRYCFFTLAHHRSSFITAEYLSTESSYNASACFFFHMLLPYPVTFRQTILIDEEKEPQETYHTFTINTFYLNSTLRSWYLFICLVCLFLVSPTPVERTRNSLRLFSY